MTPPDPFTVHVIEDDASLRDAISSLLRSADFAVSTYVSAEEFLLKKTVASAGCILLDVQLPGSSGVELQAELNFSGCPLPVVFLTGNGTIPMTVQAMRAGAIEFLTKPFTDAALLDAIARAAEQNRAWTQTNEEEASLRARFALLSPRQREVFVGVARGRLNKVIAAELGITEITVKVHRRAVMEKLQSRNLADLVRIAERLGVSA